jgi:hypothetical protein
MEKCLTLPQRRESFADAKVTIIATAVLGIWLAGVIFTAIHHEFGRDEVRAFSLARSAVSPLDLFPLLRNEGHPLLWYVLLYIGKSIVDMPLVLPITSITIAFIAVAVFIFFSPFPFWLKCLFIFGAIPFYEYSVVARNYGISMLLLFTSAALYGKRSKHPILLAVVLGLLANTNVHSTMLVCLIAALWLWDLSIEKRTASIQVWSLSLCLAFVIIFAGILLCVLVAMPRADSTVISINSLNARNLGNSFVKAAFLPGKKFYQPWGFPMWLAGLLIWIALVGLVTRPNLFLAGFAAQIALGVFFYVVYEGELRHQGLLFIFLIFLYWLFIESAQKSTVTKIGGLLFNLGLYVGLLGLLLGSLRVAQKTVFTDIQGEASSSKAFGAFLKSSAIYREAILVPEPDYFIESLPYYAKNRIYFSREHRFGITVSFTTAADRLCSLGKLLAQARVLKTSEKQPVLIVLGHSEVGANGLHKKSFGHSEVGANGLHKKNFSYNKVFTWSSDEIEDFKESTVMVAEFNSSYGKENYRVYAVK